MDQNQMPSGAPMQQQQALAQQGQLPAPNPEITSPVVQAHMDELEQMRSLLDGKLGQAYDRVTTAGMKMMYSPDNAELLHSLVTDESIPVANKLGEGIANLLVMMDNQGNGTIPKEILVPVGVTLMFEAADYLFEVDVPVSEDDLAKALELMINGIFVGYGIDPSKIDKVIDDMGAKLGFEEGSGDEPEPAEEDMAEGQSGEDAEEAAFNQAVAQNAPQV